MSVSSDGSSRMYQGTVTTNITKGTNATYYLIVSRDASSANKTFSKKVLFLKDSGFIGSFEDASNSSWSGKVVFGDTIEYRGGVYLSKLLPNTVGYFWEDPNKSA